MCLAIIASLVFAVSARAETLEEALARAYQSSPQLNAERAKQRGTDENVPQALAGYRPQIIASLSAGLQAVRDLFPTNTIQTLDQSRRIERVDHIEQLDGSPRFV